MTGREMANALRKMGFKATSSVRTYEKEMEKEDRDLDCWVVWGGRDDRKNGKKAVWVNVVGNGMWCYETKDAWWEDRKEKVELVVIALYNAGYTLMSSIDWFPTLPKGEWAYSAPRDGFYVWKE